MKINVNNPKLLKFIDDYGFFIIILLFTIEFHISSIVWIYLSPFFNLWDKVGYSFTFLLFPLFIVVIQAVIKEKFPENKEAMNFLKIFSFLYNIPIFIISQIMVFVPFNFVSYLSITLSMLPIIEAYFWMGHKFWKTQIPKSLLIIGPPTVVIIYIVNVFRPRSTDPGIYIFTAIMVIICIPSFAILLVNYIQKKKTRRQSKLEDKN